MDTLPDELLLHILHLVANDHVNHPYRDIHPFTCLL